MRYPHAKQNTRLHERELLQHVNLPASGPSLDHPVHHLLEPGGAVWVAENGVRGDRASKHANDAKLTLHGMGFIDRSCNSDQKISSDQQTEQRTRGSNLSCL
jgi:hypothetical protein